MIKIKNKNQKKKYKAIIFDVDGTIIPNKIDGLPSKKIIQYILKANKILHVGVASSRDYSLLSHISKCLKLSGPSIIHSGAKIIDIASQKMLWEQPLEKESIFKIYNVFKKYNLPFTIDKNDDNIEKILSVWTLKVSPKTVDFLIRDFGKIPNISAHKIPSWVKGYITVTVNHALATKSHALLETAKILNIQTSEIIGVGDGHNDLPLLSSCGLKIAMGNAVDELKSIADYIAPSVENDGVAEIIKKFIL